MAFHKTYCSQLCSDIAALTHSFYLRGVRDGSESGDEWAVKLITEREDLNQQFQFLSEFSQKCIDFNIMFEFVQSQFAHIKPKAIQHWFLRVTGSYNLKNAVVWICDECYRKGLSDGLKTGKKRAEEFMSKPRGFALVGEKRRNEELFLIDLKMTALKIKVERDEVSLEMTKFIEFIASTIRKRRDYYLKVKNEEK